MKINNMSYAIKVYTALVILAIVGCMLPHNGFNGKDGYTPTVTTAPASYLECPTGGVEVTIDAKTTTVICNGLRGSPGIGTTGSPGESIVGPKGDPGLDSTPIILMQFCPGSTSYPGVFLEYGICVDHQIWGVYSQNGGFLSLLPPGQYTSDGIGSSCNFVISDNCQISN